jgi:phage FluMu protein Com
MAEEWIEIKCVRCGHRWREDLSRLDEVDQVIYRGEGGDYRRRCPRCRTVNVITVAVGEIAPDEEEDDG